MPKDPRSGAAGLSAMPFSSQMLFLVVIVIFWVFDLMPRVLGVNWTPFKDLNSINVQGPVILIAAILMAIALALNKRSKKSAS